MVESYDFVGDINTKKLWWSFKVYVIRIWKFPSKFNEKKVQSIEMILQDSMGNRMIASIPKALVQKWSGLIVQFQMTTVNRIQEPSFPLEAFRFRTIVELFNADKIHQNDLFEYILMFLFFFKVIAEVVGKEDPRDLVTTEEKETKHLIVVLKDLEHNKIDCILFGKMVDQILPHLQDGMVKPVISHFEVSKIHINSQLKKIEAFKSRLLSDAPATTSVKISQISSQSGWSTVDELTQGDVAVKTIEQVLNYEKEGPTWIAGTIVVINAGRKDWYYKSCRNFPKKVDTFIGDRYECGKCGHTRGSAALS
ncbi:uncharacterized protein DS421_4g121390 [Arachis hypogaea]|nr:uncharacterized protein DS421_4g121390 [Arachis hypogaea]